MQDLKSRRIVAHLVAEREGDALTTGMMREAFDAPGVPKTPHSDNGPR